MKRSTSIIILILSIFAILGVFLTTTILLQRKHQRLLLEKPPRFRRLTTNLFEAVPSHRGQLYYTKFTINLTTKEVFKRLEWKDDFCKDYPHLLTSHLKELKTDDPLNIQKRGELMKSSIDIDKEKRNHVFPFDVSMFRDLLGKDEFGRFVKMVGPISNWAHLQLWLNTKSYTTPMHGDVSRVISFHLTGRKRWVFASPVHLPNCYPKPNSRGHYYCQANNPYDSSLVKKYPKFKKIQYLHKEFTGGDLISIPPKTLHFVHTLEPSFMVSIILR